MSDSEWIQSCFNFAKDEIILNLKYEFFYTGEDILPLFTIATSNTLVYKLHPIFEKKHKEHLKSLHSFLLDNIFMFFRFFLKEKAFKLLENHYEALKSLQSIKNCLAFILRLTYLDYTQLYDIFELKDLCEPLQPLIEVAKSLVNKRELYNNIKDRLFISFHKVYHLNIISLFPTAQSPPESENDSKEEQKMKVIKETLSKSNFIILGEENFQKQIEEKVLEDKKDYIIKLFKVKNSIELKEEILKHDKYRCCFYYLITNEKSLQVEYSNLCFLSFSYGLEILIVVLLSSKELSIKNRNKEILNVIFTSELEEIENIIEPSNLCDIMNTDFSNKLGKPLNIEKNGPQFVKMINDDILNLLKETKNYNTSISLGIPELFDYLYQRYSIGNNENIFIENFGKNLGLKFRQYNKQDKVIERGKYGQKRI